MKRGTFSQMVNALVRATTLSATGKPWIHPLSKPTGDVRLSHSTLNRPDFPEAKVVCSVGTWPLPLRPVIQVYEGFRARTSSKPSDLQAPLDTPSWQNANNRYWALLILHDSVCGSAHGCRAGEELHRLCFGEEISWG